MSYHDFKIAERQHKLYEKEQKRCKYRVKKCLSEHMLCKFVCKCLRVEDNVNKRWEDLSPLMKKYRIKRLWKKAKLVLLFEKMRVRTQHHHQLHDSQDSNQDEDDILDNISLPETQWKWWIIRQENTLP